MTTTYIVAMSPWAGQFSRSQLILLLKEVTDTTSLLYRFLEGSYTVIYMWKHFLNYKEVSISYYETKPRKEQWKGDRIDGN